MAKVLRIKYQQAVDDLPWPDQVITRTTGDRVDVMQYQYPSICIAYQNTWVAETANINTVTQTITDGVCPIL